jgi:flagellin
MSQINTNVPSLLAQRVLMNQNRSLTTSLERLSTGFRINRGADDPAGLIASETLRSEKTAISAAMKNIQRAEQVVNTAEGGLQEINNLLLELQSLVGESGNDAGLSIEEKEANQLQIDSILATIDRISTSTRFNGQNLLNGDLDYITEGGANLADIRVNSAKIPSGGEITVTVDVEEAATQARVFMDTDDLGVVDAENEGPVTIEITGAKGSQQFSFAAGTESDDIVAAINTFSDVTGVIASNADDTSDADPENHTFGVLLTSDAYGSSAKISAKTIDAPAGTGEIFGVANEEGTGSDSLAASVTAAGTDAEVKINGQNATTNGLNARIVTDGFDVTITLKEAQENGTFKITGGGADFSITPRVSLAGRASLGVGSVSTGSLGNSTVGLLTELRAGRDANVVNGNVAKAQEIIDAAIAEVAGLRGRLGAFQKNTLGATLSNLGVALENTSAAESLIRDTDFAAETATLTRQQIMSQAAMQALAIANAQPQAILALLG